MEGRRKSLVALSIFAVVALATIGTVSAESVDYDRLVEDLKEDSLKFIIADNAHFYVENGWVEGQNLFHQLTQQYPGYIVEQELGRYEFGKITVVTEEGEKQEYDERLFLSTIVPAMDNYKLIARAVFNINDGMAILEKGGPAMLPQDQERVQRMIERCWGWIGSAQKTKIPLQLPDAYSLWSYAVRHPETPSDKYIYLLGGIDGPSEPGGTVGYANLIWKLINDKDWQPLLERYSFCILPNANPLSRGRYSPYGEGGMHLVFDGQRNYKLVRDFPSGNIGSVFHREEGVFEVKMVKKWVAQMGADQIIGLVSQQGTFGGAFVLAPSPKFEKLSKSEKQMIHQTLLRWVTYTTMLGLPLDVKVATMIQGAEVPGVGINNVIGIPAGYFSSQGIFSLLVECGDRDDPSGMDRFVRTILTAILAMLKEYETAQYHP